MKFAPAKSAFISQMLVWSLVLVGVAGTAGVAVIWQRQLIVQTANRIKTLENNIAEIERHQTEITSELATEQSFEALSRRNVDFGLGLAATREQQIVRVNISPELRLRAKLNSEIFTVTPARAARAIERQTAAATGQSAPAIRLILANNNTDNAPAANTAASAPIRFATQ